MSKKKYIDADKLSRFIRDTRLKLPHDVRDFFTRDSMLLNFQQIVDCEPAADVKEVQHGQWVWYEEWGFDGEVHECEEAGYICSNCKQPLDERLFFDDPDEKPPYKYCPNCGACM